MHGVIRKPELQERIKKKMREEDLTFEEYLEKYVKDSDDPDFDLHQKYREIENIIIRRYRKDGSRKFEILMEYFWSIIILSAKGKYDIDKLLLELDRDFGFETNYAHPMKE
jgi:hypothetical protein